jgi:LysM repeat protein
MPRMTERGLPSMDGAPACPFVAYVDDRDGRSSIPDHRHRCFAESPPAPRAVAHQEAYCLSSAFPVCPVFQEWARREAAQARGQGTPVDDVAGAGAAAGAAVHGAAPGAPGGGATGGRAAGGSAAGAVIAAGAANSWDEPEGPGGQMAMPPPDEPVQRNPPRDWAAPPPWASTAPAARPTGPGPAHAPPARPVEGQGLAGSTADQLAGGEPPSRSAAVWSASAAGAAASVADDDLAGLVSPRPEPTPSAPAPAPAPGVPQATTTSSGRRPSVSSTRSGPTISGPAWERARHEEAYPSIRRRASLPGIPRLLVIAGAIAIAALILFMLPAVFGIGGPSATPKPSATAAAAPTASVEPTAPPAPTPTVYIVKTGDTMSKIAKKFGVTLDDLIAANKATIKNPDKLAVGAQVIIPTAGGASAAPSLSAAPS